MTPVEIGLPKTPAAQAPQFWILRPAPREDLVARQDPPAQVRLEENAGARISRRAMRTSL